MIYLRGVRLFSFFVLVFLLCYFDEGISDLYCLVLMLGVVLWCWVGRGVYKWAESIVYLLVIAFFAHALSVASARADLFARGLVPEEGGCFVVKDLYRKYWGGAKENEVARMKFEYHGFSVFVRLTPEGLLRYGVIPYDESRTVWVGCRIR